MLHSGRDTFSVKEWLAADADARTPKDPSLSNGVACDAIGCIGKLGEGRLVSMVLSVEAFAEDCARAAVVVSSREAPSACAAVLIDRNDWRAHGTVALRWTGDRFEKSVTLPRGYERPWTRTATSAQPNAPEASRPGPRDASPPSEALDAED